MMRTAGTTTTSPPSSSASSSSRYSISSSCSRRTKTTTRSLSWSSSDSRRRLYHHHQRVIIASSSSHRRRRRPGAQNARVVCETERSDDENERGRSAQQQQQQQQMYPENSSSSSIQEQQRRYQSRGEGGGVGGGGAGESFVQAIGKKCTNKSEDELSSTTRVRMLATPSSRAPTNALNNNNNNKSWQYLTCTGETMDDDDENEHECPWESSEEDDDEESEKYEKNEDVDEDAKNIFDAYVEDDEKNSRSSSGGSGGGAEKMSSAETASKFLKRLKRLAEKRKLDELLQFLDENAAFVATLKSNKKLCRAIASASVAAAAKCRDFTFATMLLKAAEGPFACGVSSAAYSSIIIEAGRVHDLDLALTVFEWWKKGRGPISAQFGASANKNGKMFVANSFLWSVDDVPKGVNRHDRVGVKWHPRRTAPSRMLFSLLDACAECGDVRRAIDMKSEILSWEGRLKHPDDFERAWCSLLKAHSRSSEPLKALSAFEEMLKTNETETKNSLLAHNILMSACVKGGRPDWARDMLDKAKENGLKPDSISYATCAAGETQAARGILGSDYACDVETLKRLFREYTEIPRRNKIAYGAFVSAFLRRGETNHAIEVLEHARNDGPSSSRKKKTSKTGARDSSFAVSPNSYFLVMRHAANEGDVDGVRKLSEMLREHPKDTALLRSEAALYESEAFAAANDVEGARDAIFRAQNVGETEAAKVLREASEKVLVALFVENEMDEKDVSPKNVPKARNVARALSLLDGAWSYDEFDQETGKGQFPKPPPKEGYEKAVEFGNVSPLAFKAGLNPNDSIEEARDSDALRVYSCEELVEMSMLARRMDSGRLVLEQADENAKCEKDVLVLDGFGEPIGVLERNSKERGEDVEEFASAETLMNSSLLVSATLKTSTIGEVALACFENTNEVPVAIVDEKTKVLIGAIFREDLFEKTKSTNCNAPTTNREEEDAKAEVGENNNKKSDPR